LSTTFYYFNQLTSFPEVATNKISAGLSVYLRTRVRVFSYMDDVSDRRRHSTA